MGRSDGRGRCREAALHYYDLVCHDESAVPEEMRRHVAGCAFCRERMRHLREMLVGIDDGPGGSAGPEDRQTIKTLSRHLDLMGQQVTCAQIRPFLPSLLMPAPEIRIPTPVTVHTDRCLACVADLAALRTLDLRAEQLERLGRLYGTSAGGSNKACRKSRSRMAALAGLTLGDVPAEILDHVSTCASCRAEVYRRRGQLGTGERQNVAGQEAVACPGLAAAELFDLVVPYGLAPGSGPVEATAAHVRACPACRERMQALHRTLYGIAKRADSGVATVYRTTDDARGAEGVDVSTRCPVQVQIAYRGPAPAADDGDASGAPARTVRRALTGARTRSLLKIACAAAVIALIAMQFTRGPTAVGLNPSDVLDTLEKAPNVHIIRYMNGRAEPIGETWIARRLNKFAKKGREERVLYDLNAARMRVITSDGEDETVRMSREQCYSMRKVMVAEVGWVLDGISGQKQRKEVTPVTNPGGGPADDFAVYELIDEESAARDGVVRRRWRVVVDSATGLPQRLEYFSRPPGNYGEWEPAGSEVFEYLTEHEMTDAIAAMFPPRQSPGP
jgi:hypothetical protein